MAHKYKHIGSSEQLDSSYKLRNAIWVSASVCPGLACSRVWPWLWQCRFAFDNPHLVAPNLDCSDDDGSEPPRKCSRSSKSKGARSGDNFGSEIQQYLTEEIGKWGKRFEDLGWAKFIIFIVPWLMIIRLLIIVQAFRRASRLWQQQIQSHSSTNNVSHDGWGWLGYQSDDALQWWKIIHYVGAATLFRVVEQLLVQSFGLKKAGIAPVRAIVYSYN